MNDLTANTKFQEGLHLLKHPLLPLVRIVQLLYLTGPFERVAPILDELIEPIETATATYDKPGELLRPFLPELEMMEPLKHPAPPTYRILAENLEELDQFEAMELMICQQVITKELEQINSLLCGTCGCTLCCVGPTADMGHDFFEIPLSAPETALFALARIDNDDSRKLTANSEKVLQVNDTPFYQNQPALYHWQQGWSLILPKKSRCPNLDAASGGCMIYPQRPGVCRKPQIFPYALERAAEHDRIEDDHDLAAYIGRGKLLAVWDCPYVRELKDEIATYAELCGLEPVFKENKA
ncbi:MAG: YkgJ family cysteine cluster protein [Desulfobulbaceae bacterium]|nr:YkgJ family cysteine cluster protein [Desulfobulbaceae bacterium]HIJ77785.1 YkgJ family cysteine cluster protein [Deltaproteobacteria bacterium]